VAASSCAVAAQAQNFDTSGVGGTTFGPNGPQGFLNTPVSPQLLNLPNNSGAGFTIVGGAQADRSMAATGAQTHDSGLTGHNGIRSDGDYSQHNTAQSNPMMGNGGNFGLSQTQTGLLAPGSFDNSALPSSSRHFDYGFNANSGGSYGTMYGNGRGGLLQNILGGVIPGALAGRTRLPPVSLGSVEINTTPNGGR